MNQETYHFICQTPEDRLRFQKSLDILQQLKNLICASDVMLPAEMLIRLTKPDLTAMTQMLMNETMFRLFDVQIHENTKTIVLRLDTDKTVHPIFYALANAHNIAMTATHINQKDHVYFTSDPKDNTLIPELHSPERAGADGKPLNQQILNLAPYAKENLLLILGQNQVGLDALQASLETKPNVYLEDLDLTVYKVNYAENLYWEWLPPYQTYKTDKSKPLTDPDTFSLIQTLLKLPEEELAKRLPVTSEKELIHLPAVTIYQSLQEYYTHRQRICEPGNLVVYDSCTLCVLCEWHTEYDKTVLGINLSTGYITELSVELLEDTGEQVDISVIQQAIQENRQPIPPTHFNQKELIGFLEADLEDL